MYSCQVSEVCILKPTYVCTGQLANTHGTYCWAVVLRTADLNNLHQMATQVSRSSGLYCFAMPMESSSCSGPSENLLVSKWRKRRNIFFKKLQYILKNMRHLFSVRNLNYRNLLKLKNI